MVKRRRGGTAPSTISFYRDLVERLKSRAMREVSRFAQGVATGIMLSAVGFFLAGGVLGPWLQEHTDNSGIHQIPIKIPETIHAPEALKDFGRLSVAWGLSYPPTEIGEIIPSSEIKDLPPARILDNSDLFISKDQV